MNKKENQPMQPTPERSKIRGLFTHIKELILDKKVLRGNESVAEGDGLVDKSSYDVIEIDQLLKVVDHTHTLVGKDRLHKALSEQCLTPDEIQQRQVALKEISKNKTLRDQLKSVLEEAAKHERNFYTLLFSKFVGFVFSPDESRLESAGYGYRVFEQGTKFLPSVVKEVEKVEHVESEYTKQILGMITALKEVREFQLMKGPVYMFMSQFFLANEKRNICAMKLRLSLYKPVLVPAVIAIIAVLPYALNISMGQSMVFAIMPFVLMLFYVPLMGDFDRDAFIIPLRRQFARSEDVENAIIAIGQLDELMSYQSYAEKCVHPTILPTMLTSKHQFITVQSAVNPVLGYADESYVGNDFDSSKVNLAFFTGPNSGGKTAFCKTLSQIQLLAQVGCYVPAQAATLTVADRIFYQTPEINSLDHDVGRFGTELKRTRDIFSAATPNSLVILDELAEGTTHKEKLQTSMRILEAFRRLGSMTILVTHNHELAENYQENGGAIFRQVEFDGQTPTHRFVEGVSVISHADIVAKAVGFSTEDIERLLAEKLKQS